MDYKEEQAGEIEALESIYYGDMDILTTDPYHKFSIPIKTEEYDPENKNGLACSLTFTYTEKYPDEPPVIEISDTENFNENDETELNKHILEQANENLGMVMIFTLVSAGQEWLNIRWDHLKKERDDKLARKLLEEEEAERKRFEGTMVTVETFLKWKKQFEDETGITKKKENIEKEDKRITGRELFTIYLKGYESKLYENYEKLLDEGDAVKVDESLFQDLDDLDLDDEEDETFVPSFSDDSS